MGITHIYYPNKVQFVRTCIVVTYGTDSARRYVTGSKKFNKVLAITLMHEFARQTDINYCFPVPTVNLHRYSSISGGFVDQCTVIIGTSDRIPVPDGTPQKPMTPNYHDVLAEVFH